MAGYEQLGLEIDCPEAHGRALHPSGRPGRFFVGRKLKNGRWRQQSYPVGILAEVLGACAGQDDVYLSMQRFFGKRTIADLAELGAMYADVDYYKRPELEGFGPRGALREALEALEGARKPAPSLAIASGRGLYLVWFHEPVPRKALPRWNACQDELRGALEGLGADAAAVDAARVLRVVGTRHRRTGATVEALTPAGEVWDFEDLCREVLPLTRGEVADIRVRRAEGLAQEGLQRPLWAPPKDFTAATLWEARLADLQLLRRLRGWAEPQADFRDRWLFLAGVAMSWICSPDLLERELTRLAEQIGGWGERRTRSKLSQVFARVRAAVAGERVYYAGVEFDPRYRFRSETIVRWLEITPEEQRELRTIISDEERRRRDRNRKGSEMTRAQYEGRAAERRQEAVRLAQEGLQSGQIAAALGISKSSVQKALSAARRAGEVREGEGGGKSSGCMVGT